MRRGELIMNLMLLVGLLILLPEAQRIPAGLMIESVEREVGAHFWPRALLIVLILLTAILSIKSLVLLRRNKTEGKKVAEEKEGWWQWALLVLLVVVYIGIQRLVGFVTAGSILLGASLYIMGFRRKIPLVIISLSIALLFAVLFGRFLHVPLPQGLGIFRSISLLLY